MPPPGFGTEYVREIVKECAIIRADDPRAMNPEKLLLRDWSAGGLGDIMDNGRFGASAKRPQWRAAISQKLHYAQPAFILAAEDAGMPPTRGGMPASQKSNQRGRRLMDALASMPPATWATSAGVISAIAGAVNCSAEPASSHETRPKSAERAIFSFDMCISSTMYPRTKLPRD
jgi:hypothetical protein